MQLTDLTPFGRLDSQMDEDGFIILHTYKNFIPEFLDEENVFLVLKDDSVRYVTLKEVKLGKFIRLKFQRNYFIKQMLDDDLVRVMIPDDVVDRIMKDTGKEPYKGLSVFFNDTLLGVVKDDFYNGAHSVLEIVTQSGREIMVPLVEKYVSHLDDVEIHLQNIDELLDL